MLGFIFCVFYFELVVEHGTDEGSELGVLFAFTSLCFF
jgi:hypothetical protein